MIKKKKQAKKKSPKKAKPVQLEVIPTAFAKEGQCFRCDGTGTLCNICGESTEVCSCGTDLDMYDDVAECPDCEGSGN